MTELKNIAALRGSEYEKLGKVVSMLDKLTRAEATAAKGAGSPRSLTSYMDQIRKDIALENNFVIDSVTNKIMVDDNTPLSKDQAKMISKQLQDRKDQFGKLLYKYDPSGTSTSALNQAYINLTPGKQSAPSDTPPANYSNAKKAPDGNWYIPDPNRPGKFLKVS